MHRSSPPLSRDPLARALFTLLFAITAGCVHADTSKSTEQQPLTKPHTDEAELPSPPLESEAKSITIDTPGLYPETVIYDRKHDVFLVGSLRDGAVHRVDLDGSVHELVRDERLISVLGIAITKRAIASG